MTFCLYLTHPEVLVDPLVPVPDWGLSPKGRMRAEAGLRQPFLPFVRHIVSSAERKALETAEIFADHLGMEIVVDPQMHENDRSATGYLPPKVFEKMADTFFASPEESVAGWETAREAQARIVRRVAAALKGKSESEVVLFVGHGAVGTLLRCHAGAMAIDRRHDQPAGGGHFFRFHSSQLASPRAVTMPWHRIDDIGA